MPDVVPFAAGGFRHAIFGLGQQSANAGPDNGMIVHHQVRANLINREEDFTPELATLSRPTLVTYGADDTVVLPAMAKRIGEEVRHAEMSEYPGVGHAPFLEEPDRFNAELAAFARRAFRLN